MPGDAERKPSKDGEVTWRRFPVKIICKLGLEGHKLIKAVQDSLVAENGVMGGLESGMILVGIVEN